jgi:hypothetical protein
MNKYKKVDKRIIKKRKRTIYKKIGSQTLYIKSKGRMIKLKTYLKQKKIGGVNSNKKTKSKNEEIREKAESMRKRRQKIEFYRRRSRSRSRGRSRSDSPLRKPVFSVTRLSKKP